jgi:DNA-binding protein HU-beta
LGQYTGILTKGFGMNVSDLAKEFSKVTKISKADSQSIINLLLLTIINKVKKGEVVRLIGFGSFYSRTRKARVGRNPKTGEEIQIPQRSFPKFTAGQVFKDEVAQG